MRRPAWVNGCAVAGVVLLGAGCASEAQVQPPAPSTTGVPSLQARPLAPTAAPAPQVVPRIVTTAAAACRVVDVETVARLTAVAATSPTPLESGADHPLHSCTWATDGRVTFSVLFGSTADKAGTTAAVTALSTSCAGDLAVAEVHGAKAVDCTVSTGKRTTVVPLTDGYLSVVAELGPTPTYDQTTGYAAVLDLILRALPPA